MKTSYILYGILAVLIFMYFLPLDIPLESKNSKEPKEYEEYKEPKDSNSQEVTDQNKRFALVKEKKSKEEKFQDYKENKQNYENQTVILSNYREGDNWIYTRGIESYEITVIQILLDKNYDPDFFLIEVDYSKKVAGKGRVTKVYRVGLGPRSGFKLYEGKHRKQWLRLHTDTYPPGFSVNGIKYNRI